MIDSPIDVRIIVERADIVKAHRESPKYCVLARACNRTLPHVVETWFYRTTAWIHQAHPDGTIRFVRFNVGADARKQIEHFDEAGKFTTGEFLLLAPKGTNTLPEIEKRNKKRTGRHQPSNTKIRRGPQARARVSHVDGAA